jgi:putative aldouronate transport system substrate-binding protein
MSQKMSRRDFIKAAGAAAAAGAGLAPLGGLLSRVSAQDLPFVTLRWIYGGQPPEDLQTVQDALNVILKERINAEIIMESTDWGAFDQKMALINAGNEAYDIAYVASWINNYFSNVDNEYLAPLDDLLLEHAPGLWDSMPETTWNAARVRGSIYGVINQQIFPRPQGFTMRRDYMEQLGLTETVDGITTYDQLGELLKTIKDYIDSGEDPNLEYAAPGAWVTIGKWDNENLAGLAVHGDDYEHRQAVIFSQTDDYRKICETTYGWRQAGYLAPDQFQGDEARSNMRAGKYVMYIGGTIKPGGEVENEALHGFPFRDHIIYNPILTTPAVTATLTGISSNSPNPERAMMFLELMNTDKAIYNLFCKGIQGTHWEWEDETIELIRPAAPATSWAEVAYNPNTDWQFGNQFNAYIIDRAQVGVWEATYRLNNETPPSPLLGFTFDLANIQTEAAALSDISTQYGEPLVSGFVDPDDPERGVAALQQRERDAGIERILAECQRQIDEWAATLS